MAQDPGLIAGVPDDINGVDAIVQPAVLQAQNPGLTVTPFQDFAFSWNGQVVNFWSGETTVCDSFLLAALIAQGAPVTSP